jgi:hypothetical protein
VFYPKKVIEELLQAGMESSAASAMTGKLEEEWRRAWHKLVLLAGVILMGVLAVWFSVSYFAWITKQDQLQSSLITSIQAISKLATVQQHHMDLIKWNDHKEFFWFQLEKSMVATGSATILAGIDLQKANFTVERNGRKVKVSLPPAEIFSVDSQVKFAHEDDVFLQRISMEDRNQLIEQAYQKFRADALHSGILKQAEEKAVAQISAYIEALDLVPSIQFE